ncbi:hypothetical protein OOK60_03135 [Trichothermofontia sichuanensis B231]|uniref:hypothetical protein n=1 Tax=Trichothermofontia sichuanensis TaxID=3045816 RepID=UPI0022455306|nr:hypothetical protein [Trichothermofontia sichuanensis]UZQ55084.1 hypothetical protein OOK60_03135 [Trichothermofontia sichuanensis B231]
MSLRFLHEQRQDKTDGSSDDVTERSLHPPLPCRSSAPSFDVGMLRSDRGIGKVG